jgi:predicted transposase YbfD/YdcC
MAAAKNNVLLNAFESLEDPRLNRKKRHSLLDIIGVTVCAVIAGADSFTDIERFGKAKIDWLRTFLDLENGIPSHDTLGRVFSLLDPEAFQECFINWVRAVQEHVQGVIAIDGKAVRRSHDRANGKEAIHIVSAWAHDNHLALAQVKVEDKSNEITAIPQLLKVLQIKGCLVTIDAMGCQRDIAQNILDAGADYLLAVKGNQETLHEDIASEFAEAQRDSFAHMEYAYYETLEKNHGRIEKRSYWLTSDIQGVGVSHRWPKLAAIVMCRTERTCNGKTSHETRYYITSDTSNDAKKIGDSIRAHWGIENGLHWILDTAFQEDQMRIRIGNAAENMATIRKIALNILKADTTTKAGVKAKRLRAGWDNEYLAGVLGTAKI